jgi:hypothetical protein
MGRAGCVLEEIEHNRIRTRVSSTPRNGAGRVAGVGDCTLTHPPPARAPVLAAPAARVSAAADRGGVPIRGRDTRARRPRPRARRRRPSAATCRGPRGGSCPSRSRGRGARGWRRLRGVGPGRTMKIHTGWGGERGEKFAYLRMLTQHPRPRTDAPAVRMRMARAMRVALRARIRHLHHPRASRGGGGWR